MKKLTLVVVAIGFMAITTLSAHANCIINLSTNQKALTKLKELGGFSAPNYLEKCQKLAKANAKIMLQASSAVLQKQSIGWANLAVMDMDFDIAVVDYSMNSTKMSATANQNEADEIMVEAINDALNDWDSLDKALAALEVKRQKMKKALKK